MDSNGRISRVVIAVLGLSLIPVGSSIVQAQSPGDRQIGPLKGTPPEPSLTEYYKIVQNPTALVRLGKALFWDTQVGKANEQACASCHFHAGADMRTKNQLSPGLNVQPSPPGDTTFGGTLVDASGTKTGVMGSGAPAGPNVQLTSADFPFHRLIDVTDRESTVLFDTNDVTSSQGAFQGGPVTLEGNAVGQRTRCDSTPGAPFVINNLNTRKVEPRNTPTMINAAFNHRNFWDGRANNVFNGVNPFGWRGINANPPARIYVNNGGAVQPAILALENMSAASQAVGPVLSSFEMTCEGKSFPDVGRRLMQQRALQNQPVAADDSVFASIVSPGGGLNANYRQLVHQAFKPEYWDNNQFFTVESSTGNITKGGGAANGHQLDELNFSMFFGLAVDAYERTLISDKTPFDSGSMNDAAQKGKDIFTGKGSCIACHDGPLFSKVAVVKDEPFNPIEHMPMNNGPASFYDHGFYNTGVRPAFEDLGVGGLDKFGNPLSYTRQFLPRIFVDKFSVDGCQFEIQFTPCSFLPGATDAGKQRVDIDAAFKTPGMRNVALTAPYMHNGGMKSLDEVVDFYDRGGDRRSVSAPSTTDNDTTGTGEFGRPLGQPGVTPGMGGSNVHRDVKALHLTPDEKAQLVAFMKALTDRRVACHAAPFDHPGLTVANGQVPQDVNKDGNADDIPMTIPAVGTNGYSNCDDTNFDALNSGDLFTSSAAFSKLK